MAPELPVSSRGSGRRRTARRVRAVLIALPLFVAGCTAGRVSAPDRAWEPAGPFSREAAVGLALSEWQLFGGSYDDRRRCPLPGSTADEDTPERREGLWQRVGAYRWYGLDPGHPRRRATGKHDPWGRVYPPERDDTYAWSAAFVSYLMRMAGAGDGFRYDDVHASFINQAARAARGLEPVGAVLAMRPDHYPPRRGDLVCMGRERAAGLRFDDLPAGKFPSHCAIVVGVGPDAVLVIGGNVSDSVTMTRLPVTPDGMLMRPDGTAVDVCATWGVVLAVQYER